MADYVICAACGARIRADRGWCLRCDAPLVAAAEPPPPATRRDWLILGGVAAGLAVLIGAGLLLRPQSPTVEAVASPATSSGNRSAAPSRGATPADASTEFAPATAAESARIATAAFTNGDFEAARASYEEALQKNPNDPEALNNLGQTLAHLKRTDEAIDQFRRAIEIASDKWAYHFNLAHAQGEKGDWDAAIAEYRRASELFPDDYATHYNLGMALHKKGDDADAVKAFQRAIDLAPGESTFHISLGQSLEKLGRLDDARREYSQFLTMDPDGADRARVEAHLKTLGGPAPTPPPAQP